MVSEHERTYEVEDALIKTSVANIFIFLNKETGLKMTCFLAPSTLSSVACYV